MKAEDAKKIADAALQQLNDSLKAGKSQELTRYLATMARFHRYSFGNVCLILSQRPDATHIAGFTAWKHMNRFVKKGEKGIIILAPMMIRPKDDGAEAPDREAKPALRFRGVYVFDVSQTDGEPLPEIARVSGDPREHLDRLRSAIVADGITLEYGELAPHVEGESRGGTIVIKSGLAPANEFSVTVHELAHELLHRGEERPKSKTVRETEAEAVAFVVCHAIGLDTGHAASDYIQLYQGDAETLGNSLGQIQRIAAEIICAVQEVGEDALSSTEAV